MLNGHTRGYKGLSLDSMVEFLDREIEEIDEKYQGYLNERILEKYCLNPDTEFECLGPIKNITLIPGNTFPTSKIRLYYQIDNITGLYSKFINNYNYDSGKANLLPIQLHIGGQFNKEIYPQPLLILHDAFGKIITVQIPKKQGAYLVEKTNSPIKTTVRYERSFSKTIENIKD